jgi:hypothetical protein
MGHFSVPMDAVLDEATCRRAPHHRGARPQNDLAIALMLAWWGVETRVPGTLGVNKWLI